MANYLIPAPSAHTLATRQEWELGQEALVWREELSGISRFAPIDREQMTELKEMYLAQG